MERDMGLCFGHPEIPQGTVETWELGGGGAGGRMDGQMAGRGEDRMTGWQNRVKDTLQYYVTARRAHQGERESQEEDRRKTGRRKPEWKREVKHLWFLFPMASITWSVVGGETVRIRDVEKSRPGRTHFTYNFIYKIKLLLHSGEPSGPSRPSEKAKHFSIWMLYFISLIW